MPMISVITPAHNEEDVISGCIGSVRQMLAPEGWDIEHVIVLDRCSDGTRRVCEEMNVRFVEKDWRGDCASPITEAFAVGLEATDGEVIVKMDADVRAPRDAIVRLLPRLRGRVASVAADVKTVTGRPLLDFVFRLRDLNYRFAPLGREPRGAFRVMRRNVIEEVGLPCDLPTFDTALDSRLRAAGYESALARDVVVVEYRPNLTVRAILAHQYAAGRARRRLGVSAARTLAHSLIRMRPAVALGYVAELVDELIASSAEVRLKRDGLGGD